VENITFSVPSTFFFPTTTLARMMPFFCFENNGAINGLYIWINYGGQDLLTCHYANFLVGLCPTAFEFKQQSWDRENTIDNIHFNDIT
jgi:hypothetical protein